MCLPIASARSVGRALAATSRIGSSQGTSVDLRTWMKQSPSARGICEFTSATTIWALSAADFTMSVETP